MAFSVDQTVTDEGTLHRRRRHRGRAHGHDGTYDVPEATITGAIDAAAITPGSVTATGQITAGSLLVTGVDKPFKVDVGGKITAVRFETGGGQRRRSTKPLRRRRSRGRAQRANGEFG